MKKTIKLIPAIVMLLVSAILVSTSTYAWFSMNNRVTVTGMEIKAHVTDNLLIAPDTFASTAKLGDENFVNAISQEVKGVLEPVSTVNGKSFYYTATSNVKASGDAIADTYTAYNAATVATDTTTYGNAFSENYGVSKTFVSGFASPKETAEGYIDYVYQLKAINTSSSPMYINLTHLDFIYGAGIDANKAYRVAFFVQNITTSDPVGNIDATDANSIYTEAGAGNFTSGKAVNSANTLDTVTYTTAATPLATVAAHTTAYYKVVARLWLEGEDTTCNNTTFMDLTDKWALNLEMKLESTDNTGVTNITKYRTATVDTTTYYTDGTSVWTVAANIGTDTGKTALSAAADDVKTAFGYTAP